MGSARGTESAAWPGVVRAGGVGWLIGLFFALFFIVTTGPAAAGSKTLSDAARALNQSVPTILSAADAARYREIFRAQRAGDWKAADKLIAALTDPVLLGQVMAERYLHPTAYRSRYAELRDWLADYADHAIAERIHKLALRRKPASAPEPTAPVAGYLRGGGVITRPPAVLYSSPRERTAAERDRISELELTIRNLNRAGAPVEALYALRMGMEEGLLDAVEVGLYIADIAAAYYYAGNYAEATRLAGDAVELADGHAHYAHWIGGLAAWAAGDVDLAADHFDVLSFASDASPAARTAGAYWSARANLRRGQPDRMSAALNMAAMQPRTFYGALAQRALGIDPALDWSPPAWDQRVRDSLLNSRSARRALALLQLGRRDVAAREIRKLVPRAGPDLAKALQVLSHHADMAAIAARIAARRGGESSDATLYPVPSWQPRGGFRVDRALLLAIVRHESGFDAAATSRAGARGLMQLMPRTASYITGDATLEADGRDRLFDPKLNLSIGQRYVEYLLGYGGIDGSLIHAIAAYNSGPARMAKIDQRLKRIDDALLFIESLPWAETRGFVKRVLASLWIYRSRLGEPAPSRDQLVGGGWPQYVAIGREAVNVARRVPGK